MATQKEVFDRYREFLIKEHKDILTVMEMKQRLFAKYKPDLIPCHYDMINPWFGFQGAVIRYNKDSHKLLVYMNEDIIPNIHKEFHSMVDALHYFDKLVRRDFIVRPDDDEESEG